MEQISSEKQREILKSESKTPTPPPKKKKKKQQTNKNKTKTKQNKTNKQTNKKQCRRIVLYVVTFPKIVPICTRSNKGKLLQIKYTIATIKKKICLDLNLPTKGDTNAFFHFVSVHFSIHGSQL